jgi:hypothetical protein
MREDLLTLPHPQVSTALAKCSRNLLWTLLALSNLAGLDFGSSAASVIPG